MCDCIVPCLRWINCIADISRAMTSPDELESVENQQLLHTPLLNEHHWPLVSRLVCLLTRPRPCDHCSRLTARRPINMFHRSFLRAFEKCLNGSARVSKPPIACSNILRGQCLRRNFIQPGVQTRQASSMNGPRQLLREYPFVFPFALVW